MTIQPRHTQVEIPNKNIYKAMSTCFYTLILQYILYYLFCYRLGFLEVLVELVFSALRSHSLREHSKRSFWPKGFYKCERMADTHNRGFREELDDSFRRSEQSLQQGLLACFTFFWWIHHIHERLGGSPENLQFLFPPPLPRPAS
jgi:hypothetical protein